MKIEMKYGDILVVDPCYVKSVECGGDLRFDGLKCGKVLHSGDDGCFTVWCGKEDMGDVGVDSGRIWALVAEFDVKVEVDSGFSGHLLIKNDAETYTEKDKLVEKVIKELTV